MSNLIIQIEGVKLTIPVGALRQFAVATKPLPLRPTPYTGPTNVLFHKIESYEPCTRTVNCFLNDGIEYVGEVIQKTEAELLAMPNLGRKSINELKEILAGKGLSLNMIVPAWVNATIVEIKKRSAAA